MRTLKLTVRYDGTRFVGWQRQAAGDSVQGVLEDALAHFEGAPVVVHGAGRTDAGVHALGQVATVRLTCGHAPATLTKALNAQLPEDLRVVSIEEAAPDFHARFSCRGKTYRYLVRNGPAAIPFERGFAWHVRQRLDVAAMQQAAAAFVGTHDFAGFQSVGTMVNGTVRTLTASCISQVGEAAAYATTLPAAAETGNGVLLAYEVSGEGFLRHMVRTMVGTLVEVGKGWRAADSIPELLAGRRRAASGATAPPHGLFLVRVDYH